MGVQLLVRFQAIHKRKEKGAMVWTYGFHKGSSEPCHSKSSASSYQLKAIWLQDAKQDQIGDFTLGMIIE